MNETLYSWTFNFHKVVRQQNSGAVEDFILAYSAVYLRIQKVKELLKSVNICQSYSKNKSGPVFWLTVYIIQRHFTESNRALEWYTK